MTHRKAEDEKAFWQGEIGKRLKTLTAERETVIATRTRMIEQAQQDIAAGLTDDALSDLMEIRCLDREASILTMAIRQFDGLADVEGEG